MAGTALYATLEQAKARMELLDADTKFDELIGMLLEVASRKIDDYCNVVHGHFGASTTTETRYYTAEEGHTLKVDNLLSISSSGLETDDGANRTYSSTWSTGDFDLLPYNAALENRPYWQIETVASGSYAFPVGVPRGVKITGVFGYSVNVAPQIREACLLLVSRFKARQTSPFATLGSAEVGVFRISAVDPDVKDLLDVYRMRVFT